MPRTRLLLGGLLGIALLLALGLAVGAHSAEPPVGLSLLFQNGAMAPLTLAGDAPRYLQEIDLVASVPGTVDRGIQPLLAGGELASLDWSGVEPVDEDWRPAGDGTFIRQRFYRHARWMEAPSRFQVTPTDGMGRAVGAPLLAEAGIEGKPEPRDDFFVRRFVARQVTYGCRAEGDCAGAQKFVAEGLVQLRDALEGARRARTIPPQATRLAVAWSAQPGTLRTVQVAHAAPADSPYGYGFEVTLEVIDPPADRRYYLPGDTIRFRVTFRDGAGRRLHPAGSLPTYGQFLRGQVASGLRYYNGFALFPTTYYALKHREGLMAVSLLGPLDRVRTPRTTVALAEFAGSQAAFATPAADGFTSLFADIPPNPIVFGGDPADDDTPVSDVVAFTLPKDALPGTYVAALKARREWGGEALKRAVTREIQVGSAAPAPFVAKTGPCNTCHSGASSLPNLLHGLDDRRTCFACHSSLAFEPDAAIDIRVHAVHARSQRFAALGRITDCALCHLTPPAGPARGLLPSSSQP